MNESTTFRRRPERSDRTYTITHSSVVGVLALASSASAEFMGLGATHTLFVSSGGTAWDTYELYATFNSDADQAVAVGGTPNAPQSLNSGGGGFYNQQIFGVENNVPVNSYTVAGIPDYAGDSMLSIGVRQGFMGTPTLPVVQFFNATAFNGGDRVVTTTNGGWYVAPEDPVTAAVPFPPALARGQIAVGPGDFGVVLGQFTVARGNTFSGDLGQISIFENGVNRIIDHTNGALFSFSIPGPGSLALFALAGCRRRRRRS